MPKRPLSSLGVLVRERRGAKRLRETAKEIGISPATLLRIEAGRVPDVATFGKVCRWLSIDPRDFLGDTSPAVSGVSSAAAPPVRVSSHFKADQLPLPETANALARMLLFLAHRQASSTMKLEDGDA
jgi:transcriptional regulator with XRE-family HTH domain